MQEVTQELLLLLLPTQQVTDPPSGHMTQHFFCPAIGWSSQVALLKVNPGRTRCFLFLFYYSSFSRWC